MEAHRGQFESGEIGYLRPDAKSQVTVEYDGDRPVRIPAVVLSTQHSPDVSWDQLSKDVIAKIIKPTLPANLLDDDTVYHVNPTGRFVVGGPMGDAGLTGRKIIVDTYGGMGRHGGGAFSGKDPSKVDRSAAYAARWVAKNLVAAKVARRCEVQLAYAIGVAEPDLDSGRDVRHGRVGPREARETGSQALRPHAEGDQRRARSAPADLPRDHLPRSLRSGGGGLSLGEHRPRAGHRTRRGLNRAVTVSAGVRRSGALDPRPKEMEGVRRTPAPRRAASRKAHRRGGPCRRRFVRGVLLDSGDWRIRGDASR